MTGEIKTGIKLVPGSFITVTTPERTPPPRIKTRQELEQELQCELMNQQHAAFHAMKRHMESSATEGRRALAQEIAAALREQAPQDAPQAKPPTIIKKAALIEQLEPLMKEPDKLDGLLTNASHSGLNVCRAHGGWDLGAVARWLLLKGHLKPETSAKFIDTLIERAVNTL